MSRMAIAFLGLVLLGTSACANLMNSGSNKTPEGRSTTSGGAALGTPGSNGPRPALPGPATARVPAMEPRPAT